MTRQTRRCGKCKNCKRLDTIKRQMLAATNDAARRMQAVDQGLVDMWNEAVNDYPCTGGVADDT